MLTALILSANTDAPATLAGSSQVASLSTSIVSKNCFHRPGRVNPSPYRHRTSTLLG